MRVQATVAAILTLSAATVTSFAHEGHEAKGHEAHRMATLHRMMPRYAESRDAVGAAFEEEDLAAVKESLGYFLSTAPGLQKTKPHKHLKSLPEYRRIASEFEREVRTTFDLADRGDLEGAKAAFAEAERKCQECHVRFRK